MKLGVITDVHSNILALDAVLNEFEKRNVDKILCAGDVIGIGPRSEEVVQRLIGIKDKLIIVRGNHEGYLIDGMPECVHNRAVRMGERANHMWNHSRLSEESKEFLYKLPKVQYLTVENINICILHYPMDENGKYKRHIKLPNIEEVEELFSNFNADVFIFGHNHTFSVNERKGKWYINSGSLGCPVGNDFSTCGILSIENGVISFEQLKVKYDVNAVIDDIRKLNYPESDNMIKDFFEKK